MGSPYFTTISKQPDDFMMTGYPYQVSNGQRLQAYQAQAQARQEALVRFMVSRGMPLEDAQAFVWRTSGLSGYPMPEMDRTNYVAEEWLRRHTNKLNGVSPTTQYLEYKGKLESHAGDAIDKLINYNRACKGKKVTKKMGIDHHEKMHDLVDKVFKRVK